MSVQSNSTEAAIEGFASQSSLDWVTSADLPQSSGKVFDSDLILRQQIVAKLAQRGVSVADRLVLEIHQGLAMVAGRVPTYYQRQLIINSIQQVASIVQVIDRIEVVPPEAATGRTVPIAQAIGTSRRPRQRRFVPIATVFAVITSLLLASCSKPQNEIPVYPVKGKLTFDGEPAIGAFLVLHPVGHELPQTVQPKGRVSQDGTFRLATFSDGDGAPEGEYTLTVEWRKLVEKNGESLPGPNIVPKQYSRAETSDLRVKVAKGKNEWEPLQLSAAANGGNSVTQ